MKKLYVITEKSTGKYLDFFDSEKEAKRALKWFEKWDYIEGLYTPNFYEIKEVIE